MKYFLYLRGTPGVGKITVARILERELGWKVFWFHDLKNAIVEIVGEHRIPRLMDELTVPVLRYLLDKGQNIIYVRPSPDKATIEAAQALLSQYPAYLFRPVRLTASYDSLLQRVSQRDDPYRIGNKERLDEYLGARTFAEVEGELILDTDSLTAEQVTAELIKALGLSKR